MQQSFEFSEGTYLIYRSQCSEAEYILSMPRPLSAAQDEAAPTGISQLAAAYQYIHLRGLKVQRPIASSQ
jgi:hypothetical protein